MAASHLIVPFACVLPEAAHAAARTLVLPNTVALLAALAESARDSADELSLTPPHERALARAIGLVKAGAVADGQWPLAAVLAARAGIDTADTADHTPGPRAWGLLTPAHWSLGTDQIGMTDPDALGLDEPVSRALLDAVRELFESEGFLLYYQHPTAWFVSHPVLAGLPSASLDRVVGRNVDRWLPADTGARLLRRLQNEVQMLLYTHPINAEREARGALPVNSFWLSGCGAATPFDWPAGLQVDTSLRSSALNEDWFAWGRAWAALDAGPMATLLASSRRGESVRLTLCGERAAVEFSAQPRGVRGWTQRLRAAVSRPDLPALLETL